MASGRHFGSIPNVPVGAAFRDRVALAASGIHRPLMAGISGAAAEGADSIVLNGGYEDDLDLGDEIIYAGHGGNEASSGKQVADQVLKFGNRALARNHLEGLPVRVVRGWKNPSDFSPPAGYRYDGLYYVKRFWAENGRSGYRIWRFHLVRDDEAPPPWATPSISRVAEAAVDYDEGIERRRSAIQRTIRNTQVSQRVKDLHDYRCQVCRVRLETRAGPYAEGAHIQPLGRPHNGPDVLENLLCLCSNHHVLLDTGGFYIRPDLVVIDTFGQFEPVSLRVARGHTIGQEYLAYHRRIFGIQDRVEHAEQQPGR